MTAGNPVGHVVIVGQGDPPPWTDIADKLVMADLASHTRYSILEGGMESGKTSLMIAFPIAVGTPEETWFGVETSLAMLESVVAAAHGAEARWRDRRTGARAPRFLGSICRACAESGCGDLIGVRRWLRTIRDARLEYRLFVRAHQGDDRALQAWYELVKPTRTAESTKEGTDADQDQG